MKEVNVKVLIPDDVDPKKVIDLSLVVRYQKENDKWQFVTMPFTLTDSADIEKIRAEIEELNVEDLTFYEGSNKLGHNEFICKDEVTAIIDKYIGGKAE